MARMASESAVRGPFPVVAKSMNIEINAVVMIGLLYMIGLL
jgi:hypothetical protein